MNILINPILRIVNLLELLKISIRKNVERMIKNISTVPITVPSAKPLIVPV